MKQFNSFRLNESVDNNLQTLLDNLFEMYVTIQHHHWNVVGNNFGEYHAFFGTLYGLAYDNLDMTAEQIRGAGENAKVNIHDYAINPQTDERAMMADCVRLMNQVKGTATAAASDAGPGLSNYLEGLIDTLTKYIWMAESYLK